MLALVPPLAPLLPSPPLFIPPPIYSSEVVRPPLAINKVWYIKLRQDQALPHVLRLSQVSHHRECISKSQFR